MNSPIGLRRVSRWRVAVILLMCLVYISAFTSLIIAGCELMIHLLKLHATTVGATLVACGDEVHSRVVYK